MKNRYRTILEIIVGIPILAIIAMTSLFAYTLSMPIAFLMPIGIAVIAAVIWRKLGLSCEFLSVLAFMTIPCLQIPEIPYALAAAVIVAAAAIMFVAGMRKESYAKAFLFGMSLGIAVWVGLALAKRDPLFVFIPFQIQLLYTVPILVMLIFVYVLGGIWHHKRSLLSQNR